MQSEICVQWNTKEDDSSYSFCGKPVLILCTPYEVVFRTTLVALYIYHELLLVLLILLVVEIVSRTMCWAGVCISMVKVSVCSEVVLALCLVVSLREEFVMLLLIILVTDGFLPFFELSLHLFFWVLPLWLFLFPTLFLFLISASISAPTLTCIHVFQVFFSQSVPFSLSF